MVAAGYALCGGLKWKTQWVTEVGVGSRHGGGTRETGDGRWETKGAKLALDQQQPGLPSLQLTALSRRDETSRRQEAASSRSEIAGEGAGSVTGRVLTRSTGWNAASIKWQSNEYYHQCIPITRRRLAQKLRSTGYECYYRTSLGRLRPSVARRGGKRALPCSVLDLNGGRDQELARRSCPSRLPFSIHHSPQPSCPIGFLGCSTSAGSANQRRLLAALQHYRDRSSEAVVWAKVECKSRMDRSRRGSWLLAGDAIREIGGKMERERWVAKASSACANPPNETPSRGLKLFSALEPCSVLRSNRRPGRIVLINLSAFIRTQAQSRDAN
ncbi:hypothetical protein B0T26DRAFT_187815 [Lasiosphaeria miniovina]|uniref:Uncharacterized protein n=1 Tax=Lasiosphaeria miniovina TaxID=1954250 RepID=A0AA40AT85_9PEZI|nr:uncharacterized protein B0T26DRAFT_187815 [Lasiosphaeria miniovina]KAK0721576.1 hypothetical protein B0T26DRAFT_187815 [Lasiosphaeria miniovina]